MKNLKLLLLAIWMLATTFAFSQENQAQGSNQISFISQIGCEVWIDADTLMRLLANSEEMIEDIYEDTTFVSLKRDDERYFVTPDDGATILSFRIDDEQYTISELILRDSLIWYYCEEQDDFYLDIFLCFVGDDGEIYRFPVFEFSNNSVEYYDDMYIHYDDEDRILLLSESDGEFWGELIELTPYEKNIFHFKLLEGDIQNTRLLRYLKWIEDDDNKDDPD